MAVNYASKYSQNVDERFSTGSLTNGIVNGEFDWIGVSTVNVYSMVRYRYRDCKWRYRKS